ncbi:MAG: hypothetical protein ABI895_00220 [Deltaproteobacteria bacterium]
MAADRSSTSSEQEPDAEDDHEVTPVGDASKVLLELSSTGDQNTRAYQAPRELLELARRQQAARALTRSQAPLTTPSQAPPMTPAQAPPMTPARAPVMTPARAPAIRPVEDDAAPPRPIGESLPPRERPTRRPVRSDSMAESSAPQITIEPASSSLEAVEAAKESDAFEAGMNAPGSVNDAAPSVTRSRPSRALDEDPGAAPAPSSASLSDLVREASRPDSSSSLAAPRVPNAADSAAASSRTHPAQRLPLAALAVIVGICLAIGFILAKWRGLDLLLPRH